LHIDIIKFGGICVHFISPEFNLVIFYFVKATNSTLSQGFLAIEVDCEVENTNLLLMTCCIFIKNQTTTYKIKHPT
jgi:hypothetical protein